MEEHGYTILRAMGQGTGCHNRVYEARDREGRLRVVKQLPWLGEDNRESAMREVQLLSSLRHPCIVPYLSHFLTRSTPSLPSQDILCLVMSRCERDLRQECLRFRLTWELEHEAVPVLGSSRPKPVGMCFPESQVQSWLVQLCWGMQHLHSRKLLHRDLKSQNVLLSNGGKRAMLADFGVTGQVDHTEDMRRSIVGTPSFMSPEMLEGRPYGLKTDQWALGCVVFEMMALDPPFGGHGESYASVVNAVLHAPPLEAPPGFSSELNKIVEGLLARKPHERPSNRELLRNSILRVPFHTFVQSINAAAAATTASATAQGGCGAGPYGHTQHWSRPHSSTGVGMSRTADPLGWEHKPIVQTSHVCDIGTGTLSMGSTGQLPVQQALGTPFEDPYFGDGVDVEADADVASYTSDFESETMAGSSPTLTNRGGGCISCESATASHSVASFGTMCGTGGLHIGKTGGGAAGSSFGVGPSATVGSLGVVLGTGSCGIGTPIADHSGLSGGGSSGCGLSGVAIRSDFDSLSSGRCTALAEHPADADDLGGVDLDIGEWQQLLAEAESLLLPEQDEGHLHGAEEALRLRGALQRCLGSAERVEWALSFLKERRPLGDTVEADELLLQVELLDLLGEEGLQTLPMLERLISLEVSLNPCSYSSVDSQRRCGI